MNLVFARELTLFLWLICLQTLFSHAYRTSNENDLTDTFRARGALQPAYSEFAPIHTPVKHNSDNFYGKAHDTPAVSNFKAGQPKVDVKDVFRGIPSRDHEQSYEEEHAKIVSEPIPNLIHDKAASIYVEPEKVKIVKEPYESDSAYQKEQYGHPVDDHGHDAYVDQGSKESYHPQPHEDADAYEPTEEPRKVPEVPIISVYHPIAPTTNRLKPSVKPAKNSTAEPNTYYFITKPPSTKAQTTPPSISNPWEGAQDEHYDSVTVPPPKNVNRSYEVAQGIYKPISTQNKTGIVSHPTDPLGGQYDRVTVSPINRQNSSFGIHQGPYKPIITEKKPEIVSLPSVTKPVVQQGSAANNYSMGDRYMMAIPLQKLRRPQQEKKHPKYDDFNTPDQWIMATSPPAPVAPTGSRYGQATTASAPSGNQYHVLPPSPPPDASRYYEKVTSTTTRSPFVTRPTTQPTKYSRPQKFTSPAGTITTTTENSVTDKQPNPTTPTITYPSRYASSPEPITSTDAYGDQMATVTTNYDPILSDPLSTNENAESLEQDKQSNQIIVDPKCQGKTEGANVPVANCRRYYVQCIEGKAQQRHCHNAKDVFSERHNGCVSKLVAPECKTKAKFEVDSGETLENDDNFCSEHPDGFYQHPQNCSRIVQCFGEEIFEYPPCDRGLAFDEQQGVCNYRDQVEGCSTTAQDEIGFEQTLTGDPAALKAGGCGDHKHGDHVANQQNCSQYFRCVWGQLVTMSCPENTVFNPKLDVCDFPDQVPECKNNTMQ